MKELFRFAALVALVLGISGTSFSIGDPDSSLFSTPVIEKPAKKRKIKRSGRRAVNSNPYAGRNKVIRVGKLSRRQRREFYRRMLDIHLN